MRRLIYIVALIPTMAWAQDYNPGCTPKADTPQSILEYFKKFEKPLPEKFCLLAVPEAAQEAQPEASEKYTEEAPPEGSYSEPQPTEQASEGQYTTPDARPTWDDPQAPRPWNYKGGYKSGSFEINLPNFQFHFSYNRKR